MAQIIRYKGQIYQRVDKMDNEALKWTAKQTLQYVKEILKETNDIEKSIVELTNNPSNENEIKNAQLKAKYIEKRAQDICTGLTIIQKHAVLRS